MAYFTNVGPVRGPYLYRNVPSAIDMFEAPDKLMPIGVAIPIGPDGAGVAVWRLAAHDVEVPGLWLVIDREFRPA